MLQHLLDQLRTGKIFNQGTPILVACSGGRDSMALLHGLLAAGCKQLEVAHANFQLRGVESDGDEALVRDFCRERNLPFHCRKMDTATVAAQRKISIQMAARELRYEWMEQIRRERGLHLIATAHHKDDQVETILFNIIQGSGIEGLKGMTARNGSIIRPLLGVERSEIDEYVRMHNIPFREDSSNENTYYRRNFIRHELLPIMKQINPSIISTLADFGERMRQAGHLYHEQVAAVKKKVLVPWKEGYRLYLIYLLQHPAADTLLYEMLQPFGVSPPLAAEIMKTISGAKRENASGQQFLTASHRLIADKRSLFILPLTSERQSLLVLDKVPGRIIFNEYEMDIRRVPKGKANIKSGNRFAYLDAEKVKPPLTMRYPQTGDYFYPFGMGRLKDRDKPGKKKLSKFFKDIQLPVAEREYTPLLFSGNHLVWVIGHRIDDRFKVTEETKEVLIISLPPGFREK